MRKELMKHNAEHRRRRRRIHPTKKQKSAKEAASHSPTWFRLQSYNYIHRTAQYTMTIEDNTHSANLYKVLRLQMKITGNVNADGILEVNNLIYYSRLSSVDISTTHEEL